MVMPKNEREEIQFRISNETILSAEQYQFICLRLIDSMKQLEEKLHSKDKELSTQKELAERYRSLYKEKLNNSNKDVILQLHYPYYGTSCLSVRMEIDDSPLGDWTKLYNDYNEKMFEGLSIEAIKFMNDLVDRKYI